MTLLKNMSVKAKLLSGLILLCCAILIQGGVIYVLNTSTIDEIVQTREQTLPGTLNFIEIRRDIELIQGWLTDIAATRGAKGYDDGFDEAETYYKDAVSRIEKASQASRSIADADTVQRLKALQKSLDDFYDMGKQMAKVYIADGPEKGNPMMGEFDPYTARLSGMVQELVADQVSLLENTFKGISDQASSKSRVMMMAVVVILLLSGLFGFLVVFPISTSLKKAVARFQDIAEDDADLTERLDVSSNDEIGQQAKWFNLFIKRIHDIIVEIAYNAETVTGASNELIVTSEQISDQADHLFGKANAVAAAAEEMSSNMTSVAAASEQAATNVGIVAQSADQMQQTLGDVTGNCEKAKTVSSQAASKVEEANSRVALLGDAAKTISQVTDVITEIASQTDLLALNATIEAARAGDAGKGFAVVAEEIKSLAGQTAKATGDIREKITGIQNSTQTTIQDVTAISEVIGDVDNIVTTIASAIEDQSQIAKEVAQNVEQASLGIGEINENVSQSSVVATEIAKDISGVNSVAEEMAQKGSRMSANAQDLSDLSSKSSDMIRLFKVNAAQSSMTKASEESDKEIPDLMAWGPKLILGIDEIDNQHKKLVSLINSLFRAMKQKRGLEEVGKILNGVADYTIFHFDFEKSLFETHEYPDTEAHLKYHDALVEKVLEYKKQFESGSASVSIDLMNFLSDWLKNHILVTDKKYVPFFQERLQ